MRALPQLVKFYNMGSHVATGAPAMHTLQATYQQCSNDFGYSDTHAPRRVLTKLSKGRGFQWEDLPGTNVFFLHVSWGAMMGYPQMAETNDWVL